MMRKSLARAIEQAPDAAVVAFMEERFAITQSDAANALQRCVAAFNGSGSFQLNTQEQQRMMGALGKLYGAAAAEPAPHATNAASGAGVDALMAVYKKVDPAGVLDDDEKRKALSDVEQCRMYTQLMSELKSMPPKEAAAAIRAMMAN